MRTLKLVSNYLSQVEHKYRHVHNIVRSLMMALEAMDFTHRTRHPVLFVCLFNSQLLMEMDKSVWDKVMSAAIAGLTEKQLISVSYKHLGVMLHDHNSN